MSFEDGSKPMQDPFSDDSPEEENDLEPTVEEAAPEAEEAASESKPTTAKTGEDGRIRNVGEPDNELSTVPELSDVDILQRRTPEEIAQLAMAREYHKEDPQVPYAMWRNGTSTGRGRTTIELNPDVDELVKTAMREFESRYDAKINKADLREFALMYGLMNAEDLFEMAEEWGLQFNG